jgi:hypothetical protein
MVLGNFNSIYKFQFDEKLSFVLFYYSSSSLKI